MLALGAASSTAVLMEELHVERSGCPSYATDMCPGDSRRYESITSELSLMLTVAQPGLTLGLAEPQMATFWACDGNTHCGNNFWWRGRTCAATSCAAAIANDPNFCGSRMHGCAKSCGCDRGGTASKVSVMLPDDHAATADTPRPLVLWLHGYTGQGSWAKEMWHLDEMVGEGVIVAAPNGAQDDTGFPYWHSGSTYHGRWADKAHDSGTADILALGSVWAKKAYNYTDPDNAADTEYLARVVGELKRKYAVSGVWLAGSANGALMAYRLACTHSELFAGVMVHGAGMGQEDVASCAPTSRLHVLQVHGSKDFFPIRQAEKMLEGWADLNGCAETRLRKNSDAAQFGGVWEEDKFTTDEYAAAECAAGGSATLWRLEGAPHFPEFDRQRFPRLLLRFMQSHAEGDPTLQHAAMHLRHNRAVAATLATASALQAPFAALGPRPPLQRKHAVPVINVSSDVVIPF